MPIVIVPPQRSWPDVFADIAQRLRPLFPDGARIDHIGSTSVPMLAAKDIIDIQVSVGALARVDKAALLAFGLVQGQHTTDHCPASLDLPEEELQKLLFIAADQPRAHIHVREHGRFNQRFALISRDYLRTHPVTARAYEQVKQRLALQFPDDQGAYYDIKDPVFDIIYDGAQEWAERTGWTESRA